MSNLTTANHFNPEQTRLIKQTIMAGKSTPTDNDLALFGLICQRAGLDPFAKQIYAIERAGKWTFQISIDGLRAIADRTGQYAGSDEPLFDEGLGIYEFEETNRKHPKVCKVTVWKIVHGVRCPFVGTARYAEFCQTYNGKASGLWEKMPATMLAKCAESQALRKAFPQCQQIEQYAEVETVEPIEEWRINGANWAVDQGVDVETAHEISQLAKSKQDLMNRVQSLLKPAITEEQTVK